MACVSDMDVNMNEHNSLYLSIGSFLGSVCSFLYAYVTAGNIAWLIGCVAGLVSIWAGVLTIKEKRIRIKNLRHENNKGDTDGQ
ncbi:hypothetical protein GCM10023093_16940 [Nemorincola caseinilytica]|uniref:Uncharacterized protein n=1 Tax=Nemorincola caseinilytica TaxID=2054315 RepID=A0ABP8NEV5_9BACT